MPANDNRTPRPATFEVALGEASRSLGLDCSHARALRLHDSGVYLLPGEGMVARLMEATQENHARAAAGVRVTMWLVTRGYPATEPTHDAPVEAAGMVVTFWRHLPQPGGDTPRPELARALGKLLRRLHHLPKPPFPLPAVDPLARLRRAIALDAARTTSVLSGDERVFLAARMSAASGAFEKLSFPLGHGLIHNDPHVGNLLAAGRSPEGYVLGDWDSACWGPREIDLVQEGAPGSRFGASEQARHAFSQAYGYDMAAWTGWRVLRDLRDLHSLAAYIRAAASKTAARDELRNRMSSLRNGDARRLWRVVA